MQLLPTAARPISARKRVGQPYVSHSHSWKLCGQTGASLQGQQLPSVWSLQHPNPHQSHHGGAAATPARAGLSELALELTSDYPPHLSVIPRLYVLAPLHPSTHLGQRGLVPGLRCVVCAGGVCLLTNPPPQQPVSLSTSSASCSRTTCKTTTPRPPQQTPPPTRARPRVAPCLPDPAPLLTMRPRPSAVS